MSRTRASAPPARAQSSGPSPSVLSTRSSGCSATGGSLGAAGGGVLRVEVAEGEGGPAVGAVVGQRTRRHTLGGVGPGPDPMGELLAQRGVLAQDAVGVRHQDLDRQHPVRLLLGGDVGAVLPGCRAECGDERGGHGRGGEGGPVGVPQGHGDEQPRLLRRRR